MTRMPYPPLPCPFPGEVNPHVEAVSTESLRWLAKSRMVDTRALEQLRRAKTAWLVARTNPLVAPPMLRLLTDWYSWLFAYDDGFCETGDEAGQFRRAGPMVVEIVRLLRALEEPPPVNTDPYAGALAELHGRIAVHARDDQMERWRMAVKEYLFAQVWEAANREADKVPTLADYLLMRRTTGATFTCLALVDVAGGYYLDADSWHHPDLRVLSQITVDLVGFDNDLFSYAKEHHADRARHNFVTVVAADRGCSINEAKNAVAAMHREAIVAFQSRKEQIAHWAGPSVRRYIRGLEHWVRGHIDWSVGSMRFQVAG